MVTSADRLIEGMRFKSATALALVKAVMSGDPPCEPQDGTRPHDQDAKQRHRPDVSSPPLARASPPLSGVAGAATAPPTAEETTSAQHLTQQDEDWPRVRHHSCITQYAFKCHNNPTCQP